MIDFSQISDEQMLYVFYTPSKELPTSEFSNHFQTHFGITCPNEVIISLFKLKFGLETKSRPKVNRPVPVEEKQEEKPTTVIVDGISYVFNKKTKELEPLVEEVPVSHGSTIEDLTEEVVPESAEVRNVNASQGDSIWLNPDFDINDTEPFTEIVNGLYTDDSLTQD